MTLEDFFTLTEMKDGLTVPSRVEELVSVMQKEKDCVVKNVGDATRQWAAVASTIAATENNDCLNLFIQLDGIGFIDRWLKDAQRFCNDTNESFVEESITALLRALEKLHPNNERSVCSGIWNTVKNLLGHKSSRVQERARVLFDSWKQETDGDAVHHDFENIGVLDDEKSSQVVGEDARPAALDIPTPIGSAKEETHTSEDAKDQILPLRRSDSLQPERIDDVQIHHDNQLSPPKTLDGSDTKEKSSDPLVSSTMLNPVKENPPTKEESPTCSEGGTTSGTCIFPVPKKGTVEEQSDFPKVNESSKNDKQAEKVCPSSDKLIGTEFYSSITPSDTDGVASGSNAEFVKQSALQNNFDANEKDVCQKVPALDSTMTPSDSKNGIGDLRVINQCNAPAQDDECCTNTLQDSSGNDSMSGKPEDLETSRMDDLGAVEDKEHVSDEEEDLRNAYKYSKPVMDTKSTMDDPLELARKVAQQVEREVDCREPFCCSSSEKISEGGIREPGSPDSINGREDMSIEATPKEIPTGQSHSAEENSEKEGHRAPEPCIHDVESSQVTEAAQEPDMETEKGLGGFDLNQEVCSDEMDHPVNPVSTPIPVVSVSRPPTAPGLVGAPLQFEGTLGWKGSAATSAFRPASPRRISDGDKNHSIGGTSDSSKQRQDFLDFDLNVAEDGDDLGKEIPASSGLPSGESSVEVSPRKSERFKLDLNRMDDDGDAVPSDLRVGGRLLYNRNGHRSPSPASSSSSMQAMRNFDLNDRPLFQDSLDQGPSNSSQTVNAYGGPKPDASVISIMGTKVEVNKKDFVTQSLSLTNGKTIEPSVDASQARTGSFLGLGPIASYNHPPVFGYNGLPTGRPTMSLTSAMYAPGGTIPYMVDSRGAQVVPQIMAPASAVPPSYSQPPFIISMANTQPVLNGAGPSSRPSFDLNSGFVVDGGNRDSNLRQFFIPDQGRSMEEHLRTNSQPTSSSGVGGKRKEPDGGWESYPFNYTKHQQPPWR
ncbi:uncharacterized protein LOC107420418 [Ziziphus jujuba]|uniref:Uncharacterized protein LOC107420418 n=2 Tax=Ziziphus jujuba TaxID=326968 RepID=A0A6P3ZXJ6_ZIZJJ|nr:uncharacterized protein LOC107420418 [Ziziphus jujuba]XP_015884860.1 uncharacterized protein LOC107420418 [Ziziphus jujuba]KAH7523495.1 hypothetical protein FEM48_Zijuj06G0017200 [Ziziphus jujuba var. spinosa]